MKYYVQIEDCQNNIEAIVAVEAKTREEAKYKAIRALHTDENLYIVDKEDAINTVNETGVFAIDEDGDEIDLEEDEL